MILRHTFTPPDNIRLAHLCGSLDAHLRSIETALDVRISRRNEAFRVEGARPQAERALALLRALYARARRSIGAEQLQLALVESAAGPVPQRASRPRRRRAAANDADADAGEPAVGTPVGTGRRGAVPAVAPSSTGTDASAPDTNARIPQPGAPTETITLRTRRADLAGRTPNQLGYLRNILAHDITFGIGPAGTGKTFLAVACAIDALERSAVQRIVLTRPAVEAGERLGFLPGDLAQKVDPYLRPLYDALHDL
ncbi:MAG: PhoH family protein, partial [Burkholderiaceae bacterium]